MSALCARSEHCNLRGTPRAHVVLWRPHTSAAEAPLRGITDPSAAVAPDSSGTAALMMEVAARLEMAARDGRLT